MDQAGRLADGNGLQTAIRRSGDPAIRRSGDPAIRRSGDPAIRRSGDPAIRRSGDPAIRRSGDPAIRRSGDPAIRRSGDPAIRRSGDPAIRRSGDPAIRRSGDPAIIIHDGILDFPRQALIFLFVHGRSPQYAARQNTRRAPGGCAARFRLLIPALRKNIKPRADSVVPVAGFKRMGKARHRILQKGSVQDPAGPDTPEGVLICTKTLPRDFPQPDASRRLPDSDVLRNAPRSPEPCRVPAAPPALLLLEFRRETASLPGHAHASCRHGSTP